MFLAYLHYLYGRDTAHHHVEQFAAAARGLGHRVDVHAMNLAPPEPEDAAAGGGGGGGVRRALKRRFGRYLHDPKELLWNLRYVRRELALLRPEPPDVLLVRDHGLEVSCVPVARRLGVPLVVEVNAPVEEARRYYDEYVHLAAAHEWTAAYKLRRADAVVTVSSALRELLVERYGLAPEKVAVAPNGADPERFHPDVMPDPEFPRDDGAPRIGFVGSFQKFHGPELLAEMAKRVAAARPRARFLFVGAGDGVAEIRRRAGERAAFTGRVPHARVPGLVASLDVGVIAEAAPYQCPLKALELLAAGRAVVAPAYPPLAELIADRREGILFPPRDVDAMVDAIVELVDDPERRRALGAAAARRVRESLTWRHNAERVIAACAAARDAAGRVP